MTTPNPVDVVEAAYRLDLDTKTWLAELARLVRPLIDGGRGVIAYCADVTRPPSSWLDDAVLVGASTEDVEMPRKMAVSSPELFRQVHSLQRDALATHADLVRAVPGFAPERWRQQSNDISDHARFGTVEPGGNSVNFVAAQSHPRRYERRTQRLWALVSAHVAAARRLRDATDAPEAVLTLGGHIEHAEGDARTGAVRELLRDAAVRQDRARGRLRRQDSEGATEAWTALVSGRWSLVDRFERGGRHYLVARRNEHGIRDPRALAPRERTVASLVALGKSNKLIAYELGLAESTIATHLSSAMRKLGVSSRVDLVRLLSDR